MSARMPFMPLGSAQPKTTGSGNAPLFIPNTAHPLHRGSGQSDAASLAANPLLLAGLLGQRAGSYGASAPKNPLGVDIIRSQTTVPGKRDSPGVQRGVNQQVVNKDLDQIISPTPLRFSDQELLSLTSPTENLKAPVTRSHFNGSFETPPDHSTGSFGFSSAHIPTDIHRRGPPVRQLPSPDSSDQSGVSVDHFQMNSTASFRTSTPYMHGHEAEFIRAQRIFPRNSYAQGNRRAIQQQVEVSMNRKRSRESYAGDNLDQNQPGKRQKNEQHPQDVERPAPVSTPVNDVQRSAGSDPLTHQCLLSQIFPCEVETFLQSRMENFHDRVRYWQQASDEEWEEGLQELKQRFNNMLQKSSDFMKRKHGVIAKLEDRIRQHQELLVDREKALKAAKENMLTISQNLVAR